jgi:hypothetical protein
MYGSMWDFHQKFDWAVAQNYINPKQEPKALLWTNQQFQIWISHGPSPHV